MLEVKEAAQAAARYFQAIALEPVKLSIEEIELEDGYWMITLGIVPSEQENFFNPSMLNKNKDYKIFKIDANTGEVQSMKIRTV